MPTSNNDEQRKRVSFVLIQNCDASSPQEAEKELNDRVNLFKDTHRVISATMSFATSSHFADTRVPGAITVVMQRF